ncbi:RNA polymerase sigma-54 factor [Dysgonomonas sp. PFB1-18]|uniref:RNA polymerase factor sigma-54 n=1 Tax=unclassified Dysgonomonas TaxID=2630389 RepID=UPI002476CB92|nr:MULTISPECIES: RNA polymerase factor sigma-54 [unclassified Dysgonomonas]MDH6307258.1 RNA polymerase sigma-54 factor [Dysgonomonas sp. PF1-14]MDH6337176.1 RNA polymerase sigma-54 factor [Dysgonomonas sp. PF1-16]MDH6379100.1 RNA polymerase sigma-54 factor [Dysgonomonas sp. PFB1-18]MDH6396263.1 RNA polymerase sigma-54 factor [Dysgonomonas sp. PF1-23]
MALKQQLQLKQQQKLSPLQMQVIKLTELPVIELEERIKQELEDNPALEEGLEPVDDTSEFDDDYSSEDDTNISQEDITLGDYMNEDEIPDYQLRDNNRQATGKQEEIPFSVASSLHEYLIEQLSECQFDNNDEKVAEYIIGSIDDSGYLDRSLSAISDDLIFQQNIDVPVSHLEEILTVIQDFEPAGIGARTLQECLLLQLQRKDKSETTDIAIQIISNYFEEFSKRHYDKIVRQLGIDESLLKVVIQEITTLNPKPGNNWGDSMETTLSTIVPDFIVESYNGELFLSLNNRNVPDLRVNREYSDLLKGYADNKESMSSDSKNAVLFVKQKLDSARWFIEAIKQRQDTLQRTMQAIIDMQYDFFLTGDEAQLKPMILKDIAQRTGYDISTISRVSNSKYVQTNFGVYSLKYFFSESMQTDTGEEISSREVKAILKECIENEDKKKPLTDDRLSEILKEKGYIIARRTVAKYREQMNLPVARLRKEI